MKFGILKEKKNPPDRRVVFSPNELVKIMLKHPDCKIKVESSDSRIFTDLEYKSAGIEISNDLSDCDVLFGVKEVPVTDLIPNKKYFFFSHTIKEQPHNQKLLQAILEKNIDLYDHETLVDSQNKRLIGFGKYAGFAGTYNAFSAFGAKFELYKLPKIETLGSKEALIAQLKRLVLPPLKIVVTGTGKVGSGIAEILDAIKVKRVTPDNYLSKNYTQAVYTQLSDLDYNKRIDGTVLDTMDFHMHAKEYTSDFERFTKVSDIYISGHFHGNEAPVILSQQMLQAVDCKIKVVADISCDLGGAIACTLRYSTLDDPFYGYLPLENKEVDFFHPASIAVMAVDNLPSALPKESSEGFGEMFSEHIVDALFNEDRDGILQRAQITKNGKLCPRFSYLKAYAAGILQS